MSDSVYGLELTIASQQKEIDRLRGLVESFDLVLTECEDDFHRCERCDHQDDNATKHSDLFLLLRAAIKEQGGAGGDQQTGDGK